MEKFKLYARRPIPMQMRPHEVGEDMNGISVSEADLKNKCLESPGGMIARKATDHSDQWYVSAEAFTQTYLPVAAPIPNPTHISELP